MKKLITLFLCLVTLLIATFPVYASDVTTYSNNIYATDTAFSISSTTF